MFLLRLTLLVIAISLVTSNCCIRYARRNDPNGIGQVYCQIPFPCLGGVSPPMLPGGGGMGFFPPNQNAGPNYWGGNGVSNIPFPWYPGYSGYNAMNRNLPVQSNMQNPKREVVTNPQVFNSMRDRRPEPEVDNQITGNNCSDGLGDNCNVRVEKF